MNTELSSNPESEPAVEIDDLLPGLGQQVRLRQLKVARWILFVLAILMIGAGAGILGFADQIARYAIDEQLKKEIGGRANVVPEQVGEIQIAEERTARIFHVVGMLGLGIGLAYGLLACYVRKYPLPITLIAFAMFIAGNAVIVVNHDNPVELIGGLWIFEIAVAIALGKSIHTAISYEREVRVSARRRRRRARKREAQQKLLEGRQREPRDEGTEGDGFDRPDRPESEDVEAGRTCRSCGMFVTSDERRCFFCGAPIRRKERDISANLDDDARPIKAVIWSFCLLLGLSIVYGLYLHFGDGLPAGNKEEMEKEMLHQMLIFDVVAAQLVLIAWGWAGRPPPIHRELKTRFTAWLIAAPVLAIVLGINIGYAKLVEEYVGKQPHLEIIQINFDTDFWLVFLVMCISPALEEEFFFRYLALGHLRRLMSDHAAIWVSAVMFGLAHLHNPMGMPVLIICGAALGYMRVMSGGWLLPMLMHGGHNAVIVMLESNA